MVSAQTVVDNNVLQSDILRIPIRPVVSLLQKLSWSLDDKKDKIRDKLFLLAHSLWQRRDYSDVASLLNLLNTDEDSFWMNKNKAYTAFKVPGYFTFTLEYEDFFEFFTEDTKEAQDDFRK